MRTVWLIRSGEHVQRIRVLSSHGLRNEVPSPAGIYQRGLKVTLFLLDARSSYTEDYFLGNKKLARAVASYASLLQELWSAN